MTSNRFFIKEIPPESNHVFLKGAEHRHLSKVARIRPGERVWLFDEYGNQYEACVEMIGQDKTRLRILGKKGKQDPALQIHLAQALLKTKKMDLVIQKATELRAHGIFPIISGRTVIRIDDNENKKLERWKRIAIEAAKQSGNSKIPVIHFPQKLSAFITRKDEGKRLFLSEREGMRLKDILMFPFRAELKLPDSVTLLVGPEGGWTEREEQDIMENSYEAVSLGALTLRSETAAIVSLAMVSHFWKNEDVS